MAKRGPKPRKPRILKVRKKLQTKAPRTYMHEHDKLLLRPDVGLQPQFKFKKPPKTYRYDASLDPALSWDIKADRERGEALIARVLNAANLDEAKAAAAELQRISRPFLNWAGKAEQREFGVPTLPLFVHERLSTQAILQSVKDRKRDRQQALALFGDEEMDVSDRLLKAYTHQTNWVNRLILGDSLIVMNSLLEFEGLGGQVQMIYMDPPYGVRFGSNFQPFVRRRDVKHGADSEMTREPETVQAYRDTWELGLHSYLTYLRDRLLHCRDLIHPEGSAFVQISDENLHHVRELLDEVFGPENFCRVVTIAKTSGIGGKYLPQTQDYLLWYARDIARLKYNPIFTEKKGADEEGMFKFTDSDGRRYRLSDLTGPFSNTPSCIFDYEFKAKVYGLPSTRQWKTTRCGAHTRC